MQECRNAEEKAKKAITDVRAGWGWWCKGAQHLHRAGGWAERGGSQGSSVESLCLAGLPGLRVMSVPRPCRLP